MTWLEQWARIKVWEYWIGAAFVVVVVVVFLGHVAVILWKARKRR